jgi:hypothetical protein
MKLGVEQTQEIQSLFSQKPVIITFQNTTEQGMRNNHFYQLLTQCDMQLPTLSENIHYKFLKIK